MAIPTSTEIVLTGLGGTAVVTTRRSAPPVPGPHGVLVRVEAAGVAFAEVQMLRGRYPAQPKFPFVPGYDLVGEVVAVGAAVTSWRPGQRVAAMPRTGAWAEYVEVRDSELVPVPDGIDAESAVSVVLNGVTAWQLLHRAAKVRRGQTVLVHGVGGGVGILLAQLGVAAGVRVIGTASVRRHEALRDIGVELIDHRTEDVGSRVAELAPGGVDAIFDPLGPASLDRSWRLLAPGGSLHAYGSSATLHDDGPWWLPYLGLGRRLAGWELARLFGRTGGRRMRMYYVKPNTEVPDGSRGAAPNGRQWTVAAPGRLSAAAGIRGARPGLAHGGHRDRANRARPRPFAGSRLGLARAPPRKQVQACL